MKKLCDRWAEARMKQLCVELDELRPLPPEIRKRKLRDLQRELHPDKQPVELKLHSQPLFHLVWREWEAFEQALRLIAWGSMGAHG